MHRDLNRTVAPSPEDVAFEEADEITALLAALRELAGTVSVPVVRACLEEACEDIAHLTGHDGRPAEADDPRAAA